MISTFHHSLPIRETATYRPRPSSCCNAIAGHLLPEIVTPEGDLLWGRLIAQWDEKKSDGSTVRHVYASSIDGRDGSLYLDCRPGLIFAKCFAQLLLRPLHTLVKTVYHAAMIPILTDLPKLFKRQMQAADFSANAIRSIKDIMRTPVYGLALMAASIAVLVSGVFHPASIYEGRRLLGKIEEEANHGRKHTSWTLAKCFQPIPLNALTWFEAQDWSHDTLYPSSSPIDRQLANFARSRIRKKRERIDPFSCSKLPLSQKYVSPVLEKTLPIYDYIL